MDKKLLNLLSGDMNEQIPQPWVDHMAERNMASFKSTWGIIRAAGARDIQKFAKLQGMPRYHDVQLPPRLDHVRHYVAKGGRLIVVSEPYSIDMDDMKGIMDFCEEHGWKFTITSHFGRHNPTRTVTMVLETNLMLEPSKN